MMRMPGMRSVDEAFRLTDPGMLDIVDEHGDRVRQQIMSVFPNFVMQRTQNVMAVRHFVPRGVDKSDLHWIYLGYADDTPEMRTPPLRQLNLAGPAGFVSMEDGCIGGFVERGAVTAPRGCFAAGDGRRRDREPGHPRDRNRDPRLLEDVAREMMEQ